VFSRQTPTESQKRHKTPMPIVLFRRQKNPLSLSISRHTPITSLFAVTSQNSSGYSVVHTSQKFNIAVFILALNIHENISLIISCTESYDLREQGSTMVLRMSVFMSEEGRLDGQTHVHAEKEQNSYQRFPQNTRCLWHLCHQFRIVTLPFGNIS
jgi:hypothetical protein